MYYFTMYYVLFTIYVLLGKMYYFCKSQIVNASSKKK